MPWRFNPGAPSYADFTTGAPRFVTRAQHERYAPDDSRPAYAGFSAQPTPSPVAQPADMPDGAAMNYAPTDAASQAIPYTPEDRTGINNLMGATRASMASSAGVMSSAESSDQSVSNALDVAMGNSKVGTGGGSSVGQAFQKALSGSGGVGSVFTSPPVLGGIVGFFFGGIKWSIIGGAAGWAWQKYKTPALPPAPPAPSDVQPAAFTVNP